jgi:bifunctional non-homologous end joining protein LigD
MAYDLLYLDGHLIVDEPYAERRRLLEGLGLNGFHWQVPSHHVGDGAALLAVSRERGLAGVVAKRLESRYVPGSESDDWVEVRSR